MYTKQDKGISKSKRILRGFRELFSPIHYYPLQKPRAFDNPQNKA